LGPEILRKVPIVDELWHAGDWGDLHSTDGLLENIQIRGVYGNIDSSDVRAKYPKELFFEIDKLKVYMTHIGGYPGKYQKSVKERLIKIKPDLFICGHSHICRVMRDKQLNLIHFNPGAIGKHGFHSKRTMITFKINNTIISDVKIHEYERN